MNDLKRTIVFFHGLNTYGDDLLHLGPATLGRMDQNLKSELERRGRHFVSIDGIGSGSIEDQAEIALHRLATSEEIEIGSSIHFLGQSMGGLVARVVARQLKVRPETNIRKLIVENIVTFGTPHRGSVAANLAISFAEGNRTLDRILSTVGYSLGEKSKTFRHTTPPRLDIFNLKFPIDDSVPEHSFLCALPLRLVSAYFLGLYGRLHGLSRLEMIQRLLSKDDEFAPSDGLIPVGSQNWGHTHGPYRLDHFAQMGYFPITQSATQRTASRLEFGRLCDDISVTTTAKGLSKFQTNSLAHSKP